MEIANIIADALNKVIPEQDFVALVNSIKDNKFPVYVTHTVCIYSMDGKYRFYNKERVHSKEVDKDSVMRRLVTATLCDILRAASEGSIPVHKEELRF